MWSQQSSGMVRVKGIAEFIGMGMGYMDQASLDRTVDVALSHGFTQIITKKPEAAASTCTARDKATTEVE